MERIVNKMKIALFQTEIIWENKDRNLKKLEKKLKELNGCKIDLILLPEMSFTGFSMNVIKTQEEKEETIQCIKELCEKYNIAIGFGWVKKGLNKAENHYTVIDKTGKIVSDYTKIHPFSYSGEDKEFEGGNELSFFEFEKITFSTFICYDLRFPEIFQIASKRADVIIVPANWPAKREEHWKALLKARAIENQVYIIAINCVGDIGGQLYTGYTCIINPNGEELLNIRNEENIKMYDLYNDVDVYRKEFPVKRDRKEKLYINKYNEDGFF